MTLEKYLKISKLPFFFALLVTTFAPAYAQTDSGYQPPPMFDDMTPPMVRPESKTGNIVEPKASVPPENMVVAPQAPIAIAPRVSVDPDAPKVRPTFPIPPKKPAVPEAPAVSIAPPAPTKNTSTNIKPMSASGKASAITGPKTMPALPTTSVDTQVLYNGDEGAKTKEPTIFERHQKEVKDEAADHQDEKSSNTLMPIVPRPKNTSNPVLFETGTEGALKKVIPFEAGQIRMAEDLTNSIAAGVVRELDKDDKKNWRVQIKAYATPYGEGISSDRRIALSRALSLRSSLVTQGVPANRIDVFSDAAPAGDASQQDRIDLYLYGQKAP